MSAIMKNFNIKVPGDGPHLYDALKRDAYLKIVCEELGHVLFRAAKRKSSGFEPVDYTKDEDVVAILDSMKKFHHLHAKDKEDPKSVREKALDLMFLNWNDYYQTIQAKDVKTSREDVEALLQLIDPFVFTIYAMRIGELDAEELGRMPNSIFEKYTISKNKTHGNQKAAKCIAKADTAFSFHDITNHGVGTEYPPGWFELFMIAKNYESLGTKLFTIKHIEAAYKILSVQKEIAILNLSLLNHNSDIVEQGFWVSRGTDGTKDERDAASRLLDANCLETLRCLFSLDGGTIQMGHCEVAVALDWYKEVEKYIQLRDLLCQEYRQKEMGSSVSVSDLVRIIVNYLRSSEEAAEGALSFYLGAHFQPENERAFYLINGDARRTIEGYVQLQKELSQEADGILGLLSMCKKDPLEKIVPLAEAEIQRYHLLTELIDREHNLEESSD